MKALVAFDADVNIFNHDKKTPLDIANQEESKDISELLAEVGGLTSKSITDGEVEAEELGFVPQMNKEVMAMEIRDMSFSLGGPTGPMGRHVAHQEGSGRVGGVSPDALASRLEDMKEMVGTDDIGYRRQADEEARDVLGASVYYSPPEERQMDSIPEGQFVGWSVKGGNTC